MLTFLAGAVQAYASTNDTYISILATRVWIVGALFSACILQHNWWIYMYSCAGPWTNIKQILLTFLLRIISHFGKHEPLVARNKKLTQHVQWDPCMMEAFKSFDQSYPLCPGKSIQFTELSTLLLKSPASQLKLFHWDDIKTQWD